MITESEVIKRLQARIECEGKISPDRLSMAKNIIRTLAPDVVKIAREERAEERRNK